MRWVVIGGGGFGLELYSYLTDDIVRGHLPAATVAVVDDNSSCEILRRLPSATYLGGLGSYTPGADDRGLIAVGTPASRRSLFDACAARCLPLGKYVHRTAWVAPSASLGPGTIISPFTVVAACAAVGANVATNVHCGIGHGSRVGAHTVLGPYSVLNGDTAVGDRTLLGTRATLFPGVSIGVGCVVDAHTAVRRSTGDYRMLSTRRHDVDVENRLADRSTP